MEGFWLYVGFALAVLVLLFVLHWFQYATLYIATYRESANRRVSLAETLRRLPPVSYTHLDVYKRQAVGMCVNGHACGTVGNDVCGLWESRRL